ncbi:MAG: hypothetical protein K8R68_00040 [Bacteroidales bacterium]|nr:hypothetical protein [Bacteroidales bacterium]
MPSNIRIKADFREKQSGIPDMLIKKGIDVEIVNLKAGDYEINGRILVERKTKDDFILSILHNRLFSQCSKMKKDISLPLLIIEGNPYKTNYEISRASVKGALLSVSVAWQIPVFFSNSKEDTTEILIMTGKQMLNDKYPVIRKGYKPKKPDNLQRYFIQGLPAVGPLLAIRMLNHFGSIENIMNASLEELIQVEGIGKTKALKMIDFLKIKF